MKNYVLIVYDISSDKKRYKFAKNLLKFATRTQKSVFEGLVSEKEMKEIEKLARKFSNKNDIITLYRLKESHYREAIRIGKVEYLEIDDFIV